MFNLKHLILGTLLLFSTYSKLMQAEVEQVTVKWTSMLCLDSCVRGLEQQFRRIRAITDVSMNGAAGEATLKWNPHMEFSYRPIEAAMAAIGLATDGLYVTVRGNITHDGRHVFLTSISDNTRFFSNEPSTSYCKQAN